MSRMPVIYIAGPFRGPDYYAIKRNIDRAEALALRVWQTERAVALCPHLNTAHFQNAAPDEVWLEGDLELLRRCDAVLLTDNWRESAGACVEVGFAREHGVPVFETFEVFREWLEGNGWAS